MGLIGGIVGAVVGGLIVSRFGRNPILLAVVTGIIAIAGYVLIPW